MVARGEIWWGETPDEKGRPFLVVSRDAANEVMSRVLVAPLTSQARRIPSELPLGPAEGLRVDCVASFDNVRSIAKSLLVHRIGSLSTPRIHELGAVVGATFDC